MNIVQSERETYESAYAIEAYRTHSPGETHAPVFMEMSGAQRGETVLDAGAGTGRGALALLEHGLVPTLYDLTFDGLDDRAGQLPRRQGPLWDDLPHTLGRVHGPPATFDHVYCCDVLEHVPTEFTMLVIARLLSVARRGAFFSISLVPDQFGVWVGKPLHQTVQDFVWWRDRLRTLGHVLECRDFLTTGVYYVLRPQ